MSPIVKMYSSKLALKFSSSKFPCLPSRVPASEGEPYGFPGRDVLRAWLSSAAQHHAHAVGVGTIVYNLPYMPPVIHRVIF